MRQVNAQVPKHTVAENIETNPMMFDLRKIDLNFMGRNQLMADLVTPITEYPQVRLLGFL